MPSTIPTSHLFTEDDLHLFEIQNIYTACSLWLAEGTQDIEATFDLVIRELPSLETIRAYIQTEVARLPASRRDITGSAPYPVGVSPALRTLTERVRAEHHG